MADRSFRQCLLLGPDSDELLLEIAGEYIRQLCGPPVAEAASRKALSLRNSGVGHVLLADALWQQKDVEQAVLEAEEAIRLLADQVDARRAIFERALGWCQELDDPPLAESLRAVYKLASGLYGGESLLATSHPMTQRTEGTVY